MAASVPFSLVTRTSGSGRERRILHVSCAFCHRSLSGEQPASRRSMTVRLLRADHVARRGYRPHFGARDPFRTNKQAKKAESGVRKRVSLDGILSESKRALPSHSQSRG